MSQINQLSTASSLTGSDLIAIFSSENWDARKASLNTLLAFFQSAFAAPNVATQFSTPGSGANIVVASGNTSTWLNISPAGTLASLTVTLPLNTSTLDGSEVLISTTQQITTLSIGLNGATAVSGAPANLGAGGFCRLRFYQPMNTWYRIA